MDFWSFIEELFEVNEGILNKEQRRHHFEQIIMDYLSALKEEDLPALRAAIRVARWE